MKPLILLSLNLSVIAIAGVFMRFWLRGHPSPLVAQYRLCGAVMWLGCLVTVAAAVTSFTLPNPPAGWLLAATGLLIVSSMLLRRKSLARQMTKTPDGKTV